MMIPAKRKSRTFYLVALAAFLYLTLAGYLLFTLPESHPNRRSAGSVRLTLAVPAGLKTSAVYRQAVKSFEKRNPDIAVNLMEISGTYYQKILVMIAGNIAPDLMWMGQSFSEFADRNVFLDLTDRIEQEKIDLNEYRPEILNLYRKDRRLYALPFGIDVSFIAYNRKLFREAGLTYPNDDWDYATFLRAAQALTRRDSSGRTTCCGYAGSLPIEVFGASIFDLTSGKAPCNRPEMIEYFRTNLDMAYRYRICPTLEDQAGQGFDNLGYFKQERIAMMLMYTMRWDRAFDMLKEMDWGMTMTPKIKRHAQWASSQAICIYRNTKHPDAAWRLSKFFQGKEFQMAMSCRVIPAKKQYAAEFIAGARNMPVNFTVLTRTLEVLAPTPRVPHLQELMAVFDRFSGKIFARQLTPDDGMDKCAAEIARRGDKFQKNEAAENMR